jgi:succinate-acetate transporter protein
MTSTVNMRRERSQGPVAEGPGPGIADPGPLGLAAFALTTFVLSLFNAKIAPEALEPVVLPLSLFYGGIAQFLAGMWEFRKGNTFGATAFGSYGAFWLAFSAYVQFVEPKLTASGASASDVKLATGLFLVGWALFTLYMLLASLRTNGRDHLRVTSQVRARGGGARGRDQLPEAIRALVLDDQRLRNDLCWSVFDC